MVVAALLTVGAVAFILLIRQKDIPEDTDSSPTRHLEERKARIYEGLRDLQFEFRVGKLSEDDYQTAKAELQKELARVNKQIERVTGQEPAKPEPEPQPEPEKPVTARKCPSCGAEFEVAMKFCGECGQPMVGGAT